MHIKDKEMLYDGIQVRLAGAIEMLEEYDSEQKICSHHTIDVLRLMIEKCLDNMVGLKPPAKPKIEEYERGTPINALVADRLSNALCVINLAEEHPFNPDELKIVKWTIDRALRV